ncbi:MAG: N-6 DNA methylase [Candidatus Hodarchaeales archaeon]
MVIGINHNNDVFIYRKDLIKAKNLKLIFNRIRNYLAGNISGTTRDEVLAEQLIFLMFCKIKDELITKSNEPMIFQVNHPNSIVLKERIMTLFSILKSENQNIFEEKDEIFIDESTLELIVKDLETLCIIEASRDAIGDVFEIFLGPSLRGNKGQFFTPKNIVKTMIKLLDPKREEKVIDPACGSGGFLIETAMYSNEETNFNFNSNIQEKQLFGIDKDQFLVKLAKIYLLILGAKNNRIFCENSLLPTPKWKLEVSSEIKFANFDIVVTNPPFGVKIPIKSQETLKHYDLGFKWRKMNKRKTKWQKTGVIHEKQPPQILFIERCLDLLKPKGKLGIVLPDGIFGNPSNRYILQFLLERTKIKAIISCSHLSFLPHTHTKTSLLFLEKNIPENDYSFFMAIADNVGHDKNGKILYHIDSKGEYILDARGRKIINDDFPTIIDNYYRYLNNELKDFSHLGFPFQFSQIINSILIPEYYNPDIEKQLNNIIKQGEYQFVSIGKLLNEGIIELTRGHEIGSKFYGTGEIPFIRTSDLINWELDISPKKKISQDIWELYKDKQDIKANDILFVSDGTFLIGKTAMITENDSQIVIQSHLKKIRVIKHDLIDEFLLLWALNTNIVQNQIKAKTFIQVIQATISTLGNRIEEIMLPIPVSIEKRQEISKEIKEIISEKEILKQRISKTVNLI